MTRQRILGVLTAACCVALALWYFSGIRTESEFLNKFQSAVIARDAVALNKALQRNKTEINPSLDRKTITMVLGHGDVYASAIVLNQTSMPSLREDATGAYVRASDNIASFERIVALGLDPIKGFDPYHPWIVARIKEERDPAYLTALRMVMSPEAQQKGDDAYAAFLERKAADDLRKSLAPDCAALGRLAKQQGYGFIERNAALSELRRKGGCS